MMDEQQDERYEKYDLTEEQWDSLNMADSETVEKQAEVLKEVAAEHGFYPHTIVYTTFPYVFARPVEKHTTVEDIENGWKLTDWIDGWGPGEGWRIQLNRVLTPLESRRVVTRIGNNDTFDAASGHYNFEATLDLFKNLCGDDLQMVKCRVNLIEATEIINGWEPVFPKPADIKIEIKS